MMRTGAGIRLTGLKPTRSNRARLSRSVEAVGKVNIYRSR